MKTFLDIMKILLTKDGNRWVFATLCADVVALFFIRCIFTWIVFVFSCAYLIWPLIIFLFQRYRSYSEKKYISDKMQRKKLMIVSCEKN